MKHIYLIAAINNLEPIKKTLDLLDYEDNTFLLHVDIKAGNVYSDLMPYVKRGTLICIP